MGERGVIHDALPAIARKIACGVRHVFGDQCAIAAGQIVNRGPDGRSDSVVLVH